MVEDWQEKFCCLCGDKATDENPITREHVPPKQFYPKSVRAEQNLNLWIVPTCRACNESYKPDEEYFYHALYPLVANSNRRMGETILQDLRRRSKQPQTPILIRSVLQTSRTRTDGGIVLPPGTIQLSVDESRIQRVAIKIASCLYYRDHNRVMPYENCKDVRICEREQDVPELYRLSAELSKVHVDDVKPMDSADTIVVADDQAGKPTAASSDIFSYRAAQVDDLYLYSLLFWESFMFCMAFSDPAFYGRHFPPRSSSFDTPYAPEMPLKEAELPFFLENDLERRLAADPDWKNGIEWGRPRHGHPEGAIKAHVAAVLRNVDEFFRDNPLRGRLRLIVLVHDTFKYQVNIDQARTGENHHAMRARRFAERYISDSAVLNVIELHDEAFNAWQNGHRDGKWDKANRRAHALIERLGDHLPLYLAFYRCDNMTESKEPDCLDWFRELCSTGSSVDKQEDTLAE